MTESGQSSAGKIVIYLNYLFPPEIYFFAKAQGSHRSIQGVADILMFYLKHMIILNIDIYKIPFIFPVVCL